MKNRRIKELSEVVSKHTEDFEIKPRRSGHLEIVLRVGKKTRKYFTGSTPSDWRAIKRLDSDVRKIVDEMKGAD